MFWHFFKVYENMVLRNRPKILQIFQNLSAQIVCPSPKVWDFDEKRLHWASVVRATVHIVSRQFQNLCSRFTRKKIQLNLHL